MSSLITADALIVLHMQRGFVENQPELVQRVADLTRGFPQESTFWLLYRNYPDSQFIRSLGWGRFLGSPDTDIVEPFRPHPARTFTQFTYSLPDALKPHLSGLRTVALAGTDTDAGIQACAFDLWHQNIQPLIVAPCCGSSGGVQFHRAALDLMMRQFGTQSIVQSITSSAAATVHLAAAE